MTVESNVVKIETQEEGEILDITEKVQAIIGRGTIKNGVAFLFVPGSTAALTTIEYEPGLLADLPVTQQIVFIELDVRPRDRTIIVQSMGE